MKDQIIEKNGYQFKVTSKENEKGALRFFAEYRPIPNEVTTPSQLSFTARFFNLSRKSKIETDKGWIRFETTPNSETIPANPEGFGNRGIAIAQITRFKKPM